jgi:hypothetical protein
LKNLKKTILAPILFVLAMAACNEVEPPRAEITVLRFDGTPVGDARVIIYCTEPGCVVADTAYTDFNGLSTHEIALPAVLKVSAFKVTETTIDTGFPPVKVVLGDDSLCGDEFITLIEDEVTKKTVITYPCN